MTDFAPFRRAVLAHYRAAGRVFPWRSEKDPYRILVSEFMLQQTQVERVRQNYHAFLERFPDMHSLASASPKEVLAAWSGLGYNRRALNLHRTALLLCEEFDGRIPASAEELGSLPGVGPATAAAIGAFAFGLPTVLLETNIRAVFIHFFFPKRDRVRDAEILPLVRRTLDRRNPRRWYYALMDYGVRLKREGFVANERSAHYRRQSRFRGSTREARGAILRALLGRGALGVPSLSRTVRRDPQELRAILGDLEREGFLRRTGRRYRLA